jgi:hypothetical protein
MGPGLPVSLLLLQACRIIVHFDNFTAKPVRRLGGLEEALGGFALRTVRLRKSPDRCLLKL